MTAWHSRVPSLAVLRVRGGKARDFLQGQLSCDMREITPARGGLGLHCNPAGRVIADLLIVQHGAEEYFLVTQRGLIDALRDTLARYAVFSRTNVEADLAWHVFGRQHTPENESELLRVQRLGESTLACIYPQAGLSLVITTECDLPAELKVGSDERPENHWLLQEWRSGIVHVLPPHSGQHTPQSLNYDLTGHINFGKGCYTGQEVIARLHYRGKAKKRLTLWRTEGRQAVTSSLSNSQGDLLANTYTSLEDGTDTWIWALTGPDSASAELRTTAGQPLEPISVAFANQSTGS